MPQVTAVSAEPLLVPQLLAASRRTPGYISRFNALQHIRFSKNVRKRRFDSYAELPPASCRHALLVLVQHNFCEVTLYTEETPRGPVQWYLYTPQAQTMLNCLRWPRFLVTTLESHGEVAETLLQTLLEWGRLTWEELLSVAKGKNNSTTDEEFLSAFEALAHSHLIERVPPCKLPARPRPPHSNFKGARRGKSANSNVVADPDETRTEKARADFGRERFKLPDNWTAKETGNVGMMRAGGIAKAGEKRKASIQDHIDAQANEQQRPVVVQWRANLEELNR